MPDQFLATFQAVLKERYAVDVAAMSETIWSRIAMASDGSRPIPITPAVVVTLATLGAFEWLRHRKAEVARAEASGDYAPLLAEFVAWLRALLDSWRGAGA